MCSWHNIITMNSIRAPPFLRTIILRKTIPYEVATEIQDHLVTKQLAYKASCSSRYSCPPSSSCTTTTTTTSSTQPYESKDCIKNEKSNRPPEPHILMFGTSPVYTLGRRERLSSLPKSTIESLIAPMPGIPGKNSKASEPHRALLFETKRGGQTTFHGPGQLLIWPIIDIKNPWPVCGPLDVRRYVHLLEECTMITLRNIGCESIRTKHPGVWDTTGQSKIAALGVHLRRNISSYGVACNLNTDLRFFDRIVACGLKGKKTTTTRKLTGKAIHPGDFAVMWAKNFANLLYGPSPDIASTSTTSNKRSSRILKGTVRMTGIRPELLRRLWYLDTPRKFIKWAQLQKKIWIPHDSSTLDDATHLENLIEPKPHLSSGDETSGPMLTSSENSDTGSRIQDLLGILDQKEKELVPASFRKCAGISYWTPPIGRKSSASVVRKVDVTSYRGQKAKKS